MTARRPLMTAAAAGSVLFALWFVPSANATVDDAEGRPAASAAPSKAPAAERTRPESGQGQGQGQRQAADAARTDSEDLALADTGGFDTAPYVIGGTGLLGVGAALVGASLRRNSA